MRRVDLGRRLRRHGLMRFCFLTTFFPPLHFGGDAVFVAHLANALASRGHHVEVVHCANSFELLRGPVTASSMPLDPAIRVHTLNSSWGALSPLITQMTGQPGLKSRELREILDDHALVLDRYQPRMAQLLEDPVHIGDAEAQRVADDFLAGAQQGLRGFGCAGMWQCRRDRSLRALHEGQGPRLAGMVTAILARPPSRATRAA